MGSGSEFCDSFAAEVETKNRGNRRPDPNCVTRGIVDDLGPRFLESQDRRPDAGLV